MNDPFLDEIRRYRDARAARFNYDLKAIYRDIKEREKERERTTGRKFISAPLRRIGPTAAITPAATPLAASTTLPEATPTGEH